MVNVKLTDVDWLEVAVFTVVFLVDCVWVEGVDFVTPIDCVASESTRRGVKSSVSDFDFSRATD